MTHVGWMKQNFILRFVSVYHNFHNPKWLKTTSSSNRNSSINCQWTLQYVPACGWILTATPLSFNCQWDSWKNNNCPITVGKMGKGVEFTEYLKIFEIHTITFIKVYHKQKKCGSMIHTNSIFTYTDLN